MEYAVIVEQKNGTWRAVIPALPDLSAEGASRDEAVVNAHCAAEDYLSNVEVVTIKIGIPNQQSSQRNPRPGSPQSVLQLAGKFAGNEEAMLQHIEEIYAERRKQREEVEREIDLSEGEQD